MGSCYGLLLQEAELQTIERLALISILQLTSPSRWLLQDISLFLIEFLPDKMFMKVPGWNEQDSDPRSSDLIAVSLRGRRFLAPKT